MSQTFPSPAPGGAFGPRQAAAVAFGCAALGGAVYGACVPTGNGTPDSGSSRQAPAEPTIRQAPNVMTVVFEDTFDRPAGPAATGPTAEEAGEGGGAAALNGGLGPDWHQAGTNVWHVENGRLCGAGAHNHGVWLRRALPINARIEFDAISDSPDGDLKAEIWGDGQSAATSISYTNATSYLAILGGWKNTFHVLARLNEHGTDRKEIKIDPTSDDPREKPVTRGQAYRIKIERKDGRVVHMSVDGIEYLNYPDGQPLAGIGHDHFGFNDWEVKVCFDNVKVTPL